jgi:ClpP class serine protease
MNLLSYLPEVVCLTEQALCRIGSFRVDPATLAAAYAGIRVAGAGAPKVRTQRSVAVIPLHGIMEHRLSLLGWYMGGTSTIEFGRALDMALTDTNVGSILLDCDTPGGSAYLVQETADKIRNARGTKPIVGIANPEACSGGFWVLSQCDMAFITPSGITGSHGAYRIHVDETKALEMEGIKVELIRADESPNKILANPWEPLTDAGRAGEKTLVNQTMAAFTAGVAAGRGVSTSVVRNQFGRGVAMQARDAAAAGLVDKVATFQEVISMMADGKIKPRKNSKIEESPTGRSASVVRAQTSAAILGTRFLT